MQGTITAVFTPVSNEPLELGEKIRGTTLTWWVSQYTYKLKHVRRARSTNYGQRLIATVSSTGRGGLLTW